MATIYSSSGTGLAQSGRSRSARPSAPRLQSLGTPAHTHASCLSLPRVCQQPIGAPAAGRNVQQARRCKAAVSQASQDEDLMELELDIKGMMCDGCTSRVTEVLQKAAGVTRVQVSLEKGMASVDVRAPGGQLEAFQMLPRLVEAVRALGFEAEPHIEGIHDL